MARCLATYGLESTLRITYSTYREQLDQMIEDSAHEMSMSGLAVTARSRCLSGPRHHIHALGSLEKSFERLGRHRQISVAQEHDFSPTLERSCPTGYSLSLLRQAHQADTRDILCSAAHHLLGVVRAAVTDHHDLPRIGLRSQISVEARERAW